MCGVVYKLTEIFLRLAVPTYLAFLFSTEVHSTTNFSKLREIEEKLQKWIKMAFSYQFICKYY